MIAGNGTKVPMLSRKYTQSQYVLSGPVENLRCPPVPGLGYPPRTIPEIDG